MVIGNLSALNFGASMVYPSEAFDPAASLETVTKYGCTALYGVPTMFISYLDEYNRNKHKYDVSTLRTGFIAGSSCPEALMHRIYKELGIKNVTQGYGMTETSPVVTLSHKDDSSFKKATTVGRAGPHCELKIAHPETHEIMPWGEAGEICARGYTVMKGYWGDEKKTNEAIINGWMHTGDLGMFDDEGYVKIIGRAKDLIIRGGENVYPREIEEFLMKHPNVSDAHIIGVNDEFFGEEICAWIKLKNAADGTKHSDFLTYCHGKIAHYKIPRYIRFVTEFPMTVTGKVKKNEMRHISNELMGKKSQGHDIVEIRKPKQK
jgi:fatty-acyl-CoA synthase